ncbi:hypothetical protein DFH28DRAFT_1169249 [Melampsora americana]|nr:hypothetical protein DFH28DRAFT_1169249 [Melampsora americana]
MRQTPPVTRNSNRGGHLGSPSNQGTPSGCGRGRGNAWLGTELAPPSLLQGDHSPTQSTANLQNQSPPFTDNNQTLRWEANDPFTSTPVAILLVNLWIKSYLVNLKSTSDYSVLTNWLEEANVIIYFLIGKMEYLNQPSNPQKLVHPEIDHAENTIAYCVIYYSVKANLQTVIHREQKSFLAHNAYLLLHDQFNQAGRSSQLATWRDLNNSKINIFKTPLSQHLEKLKQYADALERNGFVWTRDSVMSTIYQATIPDQPNLNLDVANQSLDL